MVTRLTNYTKQRYVLNSTDDPGDIVFRNGDTVFLMDTQQEIIYSEENNQWYQVPAAGGGGGGDGAVLIASGTVTGDGAIPPAIPVGKKMPQTDFVFNIWVDNGTEITPTSSTNRAYVWAQIVVQKKFGEYALSAVGNNNITTKLTYPTVNTSTGVTTDRTPAPGQASSGGFTRWTTAATEIMAATKIVRNSLGFSVVLDKGNDYTTASGVTYNWELLYIGSDPTNDIVEVA